MSRFADVPSDTPHGPRPVPEGHIDADGQPRQAAPPPPTATSRLLVWGGVGIAAAATTAFGILAARTLADALAGDAEDRPQRRPARSGPQQGLAPRYAELDEEERRSIRARARADFVDFEDHAAELRAAALRARREKERELRRRHRMKARRNFVADLGGSAVKLATNMTALVAAANAVVDGFQQVSGRTDGIMRDFGQLADRLRGMFDCAPATRSEADTATEAAPPKAAEPAPRARDRTHIL